MTLREAIESGRKIRRSTIPNFKESNIILYSHNDVLADDWEIEPEKILLSAAEVEKAVNLYSSNFQDANHSMEYVLKDLGFKDV